MVEIENKKLYEEFIHPPFSLLDAQKGFWQKKKKEWLDLGIKSEVGRNEGLTYNKISIGKYRQNEKESKLNTSIFDPFLTELMYSWFVPEGGKVLDPFAGGSVRGIVASKLGLSYTGVDLREEQIKSNYQQSEELLEEDEIKPVWYCGDSQNILDLVKDTEYDFLFTCPPYYNLEVYSDLQEDLSNTETYEDFLSKYLLILDNSTQLLKDTRFVGIVVGNIRDKEGFYFPLVHDTVSIMQKIGYRLYNEMVLSTVVGSLPMRVRAQFRYRKIGKHHQNVLIFYKGDIKKIKEAFPQERIKRKFYPTKNEKGMVKLC